jgi:hypothetical protein
MRRLETLETERRQLQERLTTLELALQHVDRGHRPAPLAPSSARLIEAQPLRPPAPPPDSGAHSLNASHYPARPAAFISEPAPQPMRPIREPARPNGRITGVRATR